MARIAILLPIAIVLGFALGPISVPVAAQSSDAVPFAGTVVDQDGAPVAAATLDIYQWRYDERCYGDVEPADGGGTSGSGDASPPEESLVYPACGDEGYQHLVTGADGGFSTELRTGDASISVYKEGHAGLYEYIEVTGAPIERTFELLRYPEKTAHIEGHVVDATNGAGLRWVSISIDSPLYGVYECSIRAGDPTSDEPRPLPAEGGVDGSPGSDGSADSMTIAVGEPYPYYDPGCAITIFEDGSFEGDVTPGYSILHVYYDSWGACTDGGSLAYPSSCSPDYFPLTVTRELAGDATTRLRLELTPRPGPDAVVQGYVVDSETQQAIAAVQVSFSSQDSWGWANAATDDDGSYRVRLRSGYTQINVWADGYLPWAGSLVIPSGQDTSYDIHLTPGETTYGGCCYAFGGRAEVALDSAAGAPATQPDGSGAQTTTGTQQAGSYEDLGGGLGPYDASRGDGAEVQDTPALALLFVGTLLAIATFVLRRK
jgi:hypothetical protein